MEQAPIRPFDLHVLSTPPAFILSQDQTLNKKVCLLTFVLLSSTDLSLNVTLWIDWFNGYYFIFKVHFFLFIKALALCVSGAVPCWLVLVYVMPCYKSTPFLLFIFLIFLFLHFTFPFNPSISRGIAYTWIVKSKLILMNKLAFNLLSGSYFLLLYLCFITS